MKIMFGFILFFQIFYCFNQISDDEIEKIIINNPKLKYIENNENLYNVHLDKTSKILHQKAFKFKDKDFYILYHYIDDVNNFQRENNFVTKDSLGNYLEPFKAIFQHLEFNICSNEFFDYIEFDSINVQKEFNAKWGASSSFNLKEKTYLEMKFCTLVSLYNGENNMLNIYYLTKEEKADFESLKKVFFDIIFK